MSLIYLYSDDQKKLFPNLDKGACFLCGKQLSHCVVHWMGCGEGGESNHIFFHDGCIPSFCRRLLMDWEKHSL